MQSQLYIINWSAVWSKFCRQSKQSQVLRHQQNSPHQKQPAQQDRHRTRRNKHWTFYLWNDLNVFILIIKDTSNKHWVSALVCPMTTWLRRRPWLGLFNHINFSDYVGPKKYIICYNISKCRYVKISNIIQMYMRTNTSDRLPAARHIYSCIHNVLPLLQWQIRQINYKLLLVSSYHM